MRSLRTRQSGLAPLQNKRLNSPNAPGPLTPSAPTAKPRKTWLACVNPHRGAEAERISHIKRNTYRDGTGRPLVIGRQRSPARFHRATFLFFPRAGRLHGSLVTGRRYNSPGVAIGQFIKRSCDAARGGPSAMLPRGCAWSCGAYGYHPACDRPYLRSVFRVHAERWLGRSDSRFYESVPFLSVTLPRSGRPSCFVAESQRRQTITPLTSP